MSNLTPEVVQRFNLTESEGVIVVGVESTSKSAEAGVMVGDIIKEVNHQAIKTVKEYTKAIAKLGSGETVQLFIRRINTGFMVIKLVK